MNEHDLLDAIGDIDPKYISDADKTVTKKRTIAQFQRYYLAAAGLLLLIVSGVVIRNGFIHGRYARVLSYSPSDKYLSYAGYDGNGMQVPVRKGDLLRIVTASGTLVASGKAAQNGDAGGCRISLDFTPDLDAQVLNEELLVENLSASSGGFLFRNNYIAKIRSRGILIKAQGTVEHNTVEACGMAAILISPEIEGNWGESGFVAGLTVRSNLLRDTGLFFTANQLSVYSPITVTGGASRDGNAESLPASDILIEGNLVSGRIPSLALSVSGVRGLTVRQNNFGPRAASDPFTGRVINALAASGDDDRTPVQISDCARVSVEDNAVCQSVSLPAQILQPLD